MRYVRLIIASLAVLLIGVGIGMVHVPSALVVVGFLIWFDLFVAGLAKRKEAR